jgi:alcohol dehydrogenase class IV
MLSALANAASEPVKLSFPRSVSIAAATSRRVGELARSYAIARPLVVTDRFMLAHGPVQRALGDLTAAGLHPATYDAVQPDPTVANVDEALALAREHDADGVIAIGGGSPIDTAKAMAVLGANGGEMRDYKVPNEIPKVGLPLIAIPTTAGTGSEVTRFTVITDSERDEKMLIMGLACCPAAAIVDYQLTLSMPWRLTADTGLDSLTHAIEAYVSRKASPFTDGVARSAMALIARHIRSACREPDNAAAREAMMLGATQAGMAFSNASVCLVHGMSRPIGAFFHVPHGLSNAMLLPEITAFSAPAALARYGDCARAMGIAGESEGNQAAVARLLDELRLLNRDLEVPTPKAYGIEERRYAELLPVMASQALASGSPGNNPRVPSADEIIDLYKRVYA